MSLDCTFCVCTFNSSTTISRCLQSIRGIAPNSPIIAIDHCSVDETPKVAQDFGATVISELLGLGHARQLCFDRTTTKYLAFVDSDVEILRKDFLLRAIDILEDKQIGAVVGMAVGHRFAYGLPASLLLLRKSDFVGCVIPDYIDARETFFIQRRLEKLGLRTSYIFEAMIHRSSYRKYKPEWEGANTRLLPSPATKELAFTMKVILLLTLNSKSLTNFLYLPIFYMKFLRGFADPGRWSRLRRGDLQ